MAAEIRERWPDAEIELIESSGGRFEVMRDGAPVFRKSKEKRHAQEGEIIRLLEGSGTAE